MSIPCDFRGFKGRSRGVPRRLKSVQRRFRGFKEFKNSPWAFQGVPGGFKSIPRAFMWIQGNPAVSQGVLGGFWASRWFKVPFQTI